MGVILISIAMMLASTEALQGKAPNETAKSMESVIVTSDGLLQEDSMNMTQVNDNVQQAADDGIGKKVQTVSVSSDGLLQGGAVAMTQGNGNVQQDADGGTGEKVLAKAAACKDLSSENTCLAANCGWQRPGGVAPDWFSGQCFSCQGMHEAKCNHESVQGCSFSATRGCNAVSVMIFGGSEHKSLGAAMIRPENVRSQTCLAGKCTACAAGTPCWHGSGHAGLKVTVPPNTDGDQLGRTVTAWVQCNSNEAVWQVYVAPAKHTHNSNLFAIVDSRSPTTLHVGGKNRISIPDDGKDHEVTIVHTVGDMKLESSALIEMYATDVAPWVNVCMSKKVCLKELGDESSASFNLRNSNYRQHNCLNGSPAEEDKEKCNSLRVCLEQDAAKESGKLLKAMLGAAVGNGGGELPQTESRQVRVDGACVDPTTADPETWACECMHEFEKTCGERDDMEACFTEIMCNSQDVCSSWKKEHCQNLLSLMEARGADNHTGQRIQGHTSSAIGDALDGSVQGKCSQ